MVILARATMTIVLDTLYIVGSDVPQVGRAAVAGRLELLQDKEVDRGRGKASDQTLGYLGINCYLQDR